MSYTEAQRRLREGSEKSRCRMTVVSFVPSSSTMNDQVQRALERQLLAAFQSQAIARNPTVVDFGALSTP